CMQALAFPWTF
nr:immunoglobulin light chain junction region [Macaca mulatta]MOY04314.1 immunoglobulin light chain junction region [Macaca mulatta]MOY10896.1 immunoglobulin light chain junction region [Macaca mulatta]MOY12165.1 immunoglobulin light chain junction region [Macaca mulatta]MOY12455.1 immunoglobulin light chain junction region [Macaca mulatta]